MNASHFWSMVGLGAAGCMVIMAVLWVEATRRRDASSVDVAWAGLIGLLAVMYAIVGEGHPHQRLVVGVVGGVWGLRLAGHLLIDRVLKAKEEDGRYQELRASWGAHANRNFFWFFQAQGVLAALLSLPFALAASHQEDLSAWAWGAVGMWLTGLVGESIADRQLAAWRRNPSNRGKTCRAGLWKYSRHPNYFFEWIMWCSFAVLAFPAPWGWTAAFAPLLMLLLIVKVTGIPPTEARALRSRGDDYREYQRTTSAFIPWFPRASVAPGTGT